MKTAILTEKKSDAVDFFSTFAATSHRKVVFAKGVKVFDRRRGGVADPGIGVWKGEGGGGVDRDR